MFFVGVQCNVETTFADGKEYGLEIFVCMGFDGFSFFMSFFTTVSFSPLTLPTGAANAGEANRAVSIRQGALRVEFMIFLS